VDGDIVGKSQEIIGEIHHHIGVSKGSFEYLLHFYLQLLGKYLTRLCQVRSLFLVIPLKVGGHLFSNYCDGLLILAESEQKRL
jgi:hypothetical protein